MPLTRVRLTNFKSITDASLELKPLNIILGSNSAGKSTFLQALVLASQNFKSGSTYSFDLNNPFMTLGPFGELKHRSSSRSDGVGFELEYRDLDSADEHTYKFSIQLDSSAKNSHKSTVPISEFKIQETKSSQVAELCIKLSSGDLSAPATMKGTFFAQPQFRAGEHEQIDAEDRTLHKISAVFTPSQDDRFLPQVIADRSVYLVEEVRRGLVERYLVDSLTNNRKRDPGFNFRDIIRENSKAQRLLARGKVPVLGNQQVLEKWYEAWSGSAWQGMYEVEELLKLDGLEFRRTEIFKDLKSVPVEEFAKFLASKSTLKTSWLRHRVPQLLIISGYDQAQRYESAVRFSRRQAFTITNKLQYLGPLRAHALSEQRNSGPTHAWAPIGTKGELMAYQLGLEKNKRPMEYPVPNSKGKKVRFLKEVLTLEQALNRWVHWFDLGDKIVSKDEGVWGSYLELDDEKFHQKGTGISQVLPVLTICLLASSGSLTLIEQPELHLHPGLQQKLGTFFAEMSKSGRRLLIETHSEYLLTRVRREIATGALDSNKVSLTFVDSRLSKKTGARASHYEQIEISPTGTISRWPQSFYDFTAEDKMAIFEANIK